MTLVLAIHGRESIWMLTDRRLSATGRPFRDDAVKVLFLETDDGMAFLGYAGLGRTAAGTQPSDWMSNVLRGRNHLMEQSLGILADTIKHEFPRHLLGVRGVAASSHVVVATAVVDNQMRCYTVGLGFPDGQKPTIDFRRRATPAKKGGFGRPHQLTLSGSGAHVLLRDTSWMRPLYRLLKAYERKKISANIIADKLAELNYAVSRVEPTVGPRCIVAWRNRQKGIFKGGGAHELYNGTLREGSNLMLPNVANGRDMRAVFTILFEDMQKNFAQWAPDMPEPPPYDPNPALEAIAKLPTHPEDKLK